jgi:topoisomerase IA-like protein
MPVSTDELDMDRVKRGEYTTTELLAASSGHHPPQHVGHMDGHDVFLKHGRYGKYLEWNGQTCSANKATTLEEAKALLSALDNNDDEEPKSSLGDEPSGKHRPSLGDEPSGKHRSALGDEPSGKHCAPPTMTGVLRYINADCSVRQGKYGPYVYYKTSEMKSPMFFSAKKLEWKTVKEHQVLQWIREQKK